MKITFRSELPWKTSAGEDRYRRGMYTFFKRSVPYPDLMIFDCPDSPTRRRAAQRFEHAAAGAGDAQQRNIGRCGAGTGAPASSVADVTTMLTAVGRMFRVCLTRPPSRSGNEAARWATGRTTAAGTRRIRTMRGRWPENL